MRLNQFFTRKWVVITLIIIGGSTLSGVFYIRGQSMQAKAATFARVDVQTLIKKHPNWESYTKLQNDLEQLQRKWGVTNTQTAGNSGPGGSAAFPALKSQAGEMERIYNEEGRMKQESLNKSIQEFIQAKTQELNTLLNTQLKTINDRLARELEAKTRESETKLQADFNVLQNEYQVTLSNLRLQLSLLDVQANPATAKSDKERIEAEITRIQNEIERKKAAKQTQVQKELQSFVDNRKKTARDEMERFKTEKEAECKAEILAFRQKQESEFTNWYQKKAGEFNAVQKNRKQKWEEEYRKDSVKESIIKSQQEQLKEAMLWDIRKAAKEIARQKKIDCVVTGVFVNVTLPDLTTELGKEIHKL